MKIKYIKLINIFVTLFLVSSCAQFNQSFNAVDLNPKLKSGELVQKVDNCFIIIDKSGSMAYLHDMKTKLSIAKYILKGINQTIPDLDLKMGVRSFGKNLWSFESKTELIYGITKYSKPEFEKALGKNINWASGKSLLYPALLSTSKNLKKLKGTCAIIIISDGRELDTAPIEAVRKIKKQYKDNIQIHSILVGSDEPGKEILVSIANEGKGVFELADNLINPEQMGSFIKQVFLEKPKDEDKDGVYDKFDNCPKTPQNVKVDKRGCPFDNDKDGIYDYQDQCSNTPLQVKVAINGCPFDTDKDGVYDYLDKCPATPQGVNVDSSGCILDSDNDGVNDDKDECPNTPIAAKVTDLGCWHIKMLNYKSNQKSIAAELIKHVDEIIMILKKNPDVKLEIHGHTDSTGKESYNWKLSDKRAKIVMKHLIKFGIEKQRLIAKGFGPSKPIASNETKKGRAQNRRVEFKLVR